MVRTVCILILSFFAWAIAEKKALNTIDVKDAWDQFPSASIDSGEKIIFEVPGKETVKSLHERVLEHIRNERLEQIQTKISNILHGRSSDAGAHIEAGILYAENYFYNFALKEFVLAGELEPRNYNVYNNIANVYYLTSNFDEAVRNYEKSLSLRPNDPLTLLNLSFILYETGKFEEARKRFLVAALINPTLNTAQYRVIISGEK